MLNEVSWHIIILFHIGFIYHQDLDNQINEGETPIEALNASFQDAQLELNSKINQISAQIQELNTSNNKLNHIHKGVER